MWVPTSASSFKPWYPRRLPFLTAHSLRCQSTSVRRGWGAGTSHSPALPPAASGTGMGGLPELIWPKGADRGAEPTPKLHNQLPPALCHTLRRCRNQLARSADGARAEAGSRGGWGLLQAVLFLPDRQSLEVARVATAVWNIPSAFQQPTLTKQL